MPVIIVGSLNNFSICFPELKIMQLGFQVAQGIAIVPAYVITAIGNIPALKQRDKFLHKRDRYHNTLTHSQITSCLGKRQVVGGGHNDVGVEGRLLKLGAKFKRLIHEVVEEARAAAGEADNSGQRTIAED